MASSTSPHKLSPSRRTEAPPLRAAKKPKKYRSIADIMARAAPAVIHDDDNINGNQSDLGDREDADINISDVAEQPADSLAVIRGADSITSDRCGLGDREDDHINIPDVAEQPADAQAVIGGSDEDENITCNRCGLGDRENELLLCDKCDRGYHMDCARPVVVRIPFGSWFCSDCTVRPRPENFSQKQMEEFFRIQRSKEAECSSSSASHGSKRRRRCSTHWEKRKKRTLLPYVPSKDQETRFRQMQSLAVALTSHGMSFFNELTYHDQMAPRSANKAELDRERMQVFSREDRKTVETCLKMMKNGDFPPLHVVYDSVMGYTIEADDKIKGMTLLLEHTGDVDYIKNREWDDCDSLMSLILAHDSSKSLMICQDKRGNIGRFISGINNYTLDGTKRQNVKAVRYNVDGESRVFIIATRDIVKGERLYYDYNGYEKAYPTEHFV